MLIPLHALLACGRPDDYPVCHDGQGIVHWQTFVNQVLSQVQALQHRKELRWLLVSENPYIFLVNLLALLHAKKHVVIPPNAKPGTLHQMATAFDAICPEDLSLTSPNTAAACTLKPHDAIIELYTSGSSGAPKPIQKNLSQLEAEIEALQLLWGDALEGTGTIATVPHQHVYGLLFRLLWPLSAGRIFDTQTSAHPDTLRQRLSLFGQFGGVALISSPAHLTRLPELMPLDVLSPTPRIIFSSGGPLPAAAAHAFHRSLERTPIEVFGSTESGGIAWRQQHEGPANDAWMPLPGVTISRTMGGELSVQSPFLADSNALVLGDSVTLLENGKFKLGPRLDRVVKIEEKRLSLADMEAHLRQHAWVAEAAAIALTDKRHCVGGVVVLSPEGAQYLQAQGRRNTARQLTQHLAAYYETVLLPKHWRFTEKMPRNELGKLPHASLVAMFSPDVMFPIVRGISPTQTAKNQIVLDLVVPTELAHFAGHFPGQAILPGVLQLDWAVHYGREYLALSGQFSELENIKFLALVLPNCELELSLLWDPDTQRLEFTYFNSERKYSSGRITFKGQA